MRLLSKSRYSTVQFPNFRGRNVEHGMVTTSTPHQLFHDFDSNRSFFVFEDLVNYSGIGRCAYQMIDNCEYWGEVLAKEADYETPELADFLNEYEDLFDRTLMLLYPDSRMDVMVRGPERWPSVSMLKYIKSERWTNSEGESMETAVCEYQSTRDLPEGFEDNNVYDTIYVPELTRFNPQQLRKRLKAKTRTKLRQRFAGNYA